ncbi:ComF family protein [Acinetobacter sp. 187]|uniref:ComF family protein n=1 Tax=Acinetobacter lanii TaxID=2715163 RepID=UPI00140B9525|nr:phosphoribosyltransferase family protein [Acinetobacter lanii]NHC03864.1 ComF family protein [Acinetobacter lanii]
MKTIDTVHVIIQRIIQPCFPCQLCGIDAQQSHSLCQQCWQQLPWLKDTILRQHRPIQIALNYTFPIDRIIQSYKYEQQLHFQNLLTQSLMSLNLSQVQAIVPMPISTERLRERGYNQMLIIANRMAQQFNIPVWQPVLRLAQHSQKGLSRVERMQNIEQQFQIIKSERRKYRKVLIIDDVVTTGSSADALANALEKLGCQHIDIACIAAAQQ